MGNIETSRDLGLQEQFNKRKWCGRSVHFASAWTSAISNTPSLPNITNVQGERRAPRGQHQRRQWIQSSLPGARSFSFASGSSKIPGCNFQTPGMTGEANDAVSAYTQMHTSEAPRLLRLPEKERPQVSIRLPPSRRPKTMVLV